MRLLARFVALPAGDRHLILQAVALLALIRGGLSLVPLRHLRGLLDVGTTILRTAALGEIGAASRVPWAVAAAARLGRPSCLVQALAVQTLLEMRGVRASIRIGVRRRSDGAFEAHACVESGGRIVLGHSTGPAYHALARFDRIRA